MNQNLIIVAISSMFLFSCTPDQEATDFAQFSNLSESSISDGGLTKLIDPIDDDIVINDPIDDPTDDDIVINDPIDSGDDNRGTPTQELLQNCDMDISITSGSNSSPSKTKIIIGDSERIQTELQNLSSKDRDFFNKAINNNIPLNGDFRKTTHDENFEMAFTGGSTYRVNSAIGDRTIYSAGELDYRTTSTDSDSIRILAHGKLKVQTTSFYARDAIFMLNSQAPNIKVCIRQTSAGSLDIEVVGASNSRVTIVSSATTSNTNQISSKILKALEAEQMWRGTSFKRVSINLSNMATSSNYAELGFTSFNDASVAKINQGGNYSAVFIRGTSLSNSSTIQVENNSTQGTHLKTKVIHNTIDNKYRDFERTISKMKEVETIE
jgi:hypothetical protein